MKKLVPALVVLVAALAVIFYMSKHPATPPPGTGAETAAQLEGPHGAETAAPAPTSQDAMTATTPAPEATAAESTAPAETAPAGTETAATTETPAATTESAESSAPAAEAPSGPAPETLAAADAMSQLPASTTSAEQPAPAAAPAAADAHAVDAPDAMSERAIGNPGAPVTIIEYASLTCPHCAHFSNDILASVKAKLIDTGKARLVFRDFPLDQYAMKAAKLARCAPKDKYFDFIEVLFKNQDRWAHEGDPIKGLMQYGALAGMDDAYMNNCMGNEELENYILQGVSEAQDKFGVKSTPTFVFNYGAETLPGAQEEEKFEEIVNRLSSKE